MNLKLIVTFKDSELWAKTKTWKADNLKHFDVRIWSDEKQTIVIIPQASPSSERRESERRRQIRIATSNRILKTISRFPAANVDVWAHLDTVDQKHIEKGLPQAEFSGPMLTVAEFSHEPNDKLYPPLLQLVGNPSQATLDAAELQAERRQKQKINVGVLLLKHRISHLFLPLKIDVESLLEIQDSVRRTAYAKELLEEYARSGPDSFMNLLRQLHGFIRAVSAQEERSMGVRQPTASTSVSQIISKLEVTNADSAWEHLQRLSNHAALKKDDTVDHRHPIAQFLHQLDAAIEPPSTEKLRSVIESGIGFLDFDGRAFCRWYAQLDDQLQALHDDLVAD